MITTDEEGLVLNATKEITVDMRRSVHTTKSPLYISNEKAEIV